MPLQLRQGQVWRLGDDFIRIVHLERLAVGYKTSKDLRAGKGEHQRVSKKVFCRMLKSAVLLSRNSSA